MSADARHYCPNREPDVVLECGCVVWGWPQVKDLSRGGKMYLGCDTHLQGTGKWGMQRVLREATVYERIRFRELGIRAPKRRSTGTPKWLSAMSGCDEKRSNVESTGSASHPVLF